MYSKPGLAFFLNVFLLLRKVPPRSNSLFTTFFPGFHILCCDLFSMSVFLGLLPLLALIGGILPLKVQFALLDLFEELLAHVLDLLTQCFFG